MLAAELESRRPHPALDFEPSRSSSPLQAPTTTSPLLQSMAGLLASYQRFLSRSPLVGNAVSAAVCPPLLLPPCLSVR